MDNVITVETGDGGSNEALSTLGVFSSWELAEKALMDHIPFVFDEEDEALWEISREIVHDPDEMGGAVLAKVYQWPGSDWMAVSVEYVVDRQLG